VERSGRHDKSAISGQRRWVAALGRVLARKPGAAILLLRMVSPQAIMRHIIWDGRRSFI
jgi:hypothetical protein